MYCYIGIDIGGMSTKGALFTKDGDILERGVFETDQNADYRIFVKQIVSLCKEMLAKQKLDISALRGVGMAIPGSIDSEKGVITYSNNIKFANVPIVEEFNKYIDVPVRIGNDANLAVLGEMYFGSAKSYKDIVFVTLGTGIGTGIVSNGKLILGAAGAGAEGGHTLLRINGNKCTCGRNGCWETYGSVTALIKLTEKYISKYPASLMTRFAEEEGKVSGKTSFLAAKAGDKYGKIVVSKYLKYVSEGILNFVNVFRPEVVLIGGGISNEGDELMRRIEQYVNRYSYGSELKPIVKVKKAMLKNDAGVYGGLALFM